MVEVTDGNSCSLLASADIQYNANCIPNIECTIATTSGNIKNIAICLNNALFIIFSSQPIFLKILYLCLLSELSVSCFKANIAELAIKNVIPKYIAINTTIVDNPYLFLFVHLM